MVFMITISDDKHCESSLSFCEISRARTVAIKVCSLFEDQSPGMYFREVVKLYIRPH